MTLRKWSFALLLAGLAACADASPEPVGCLAPDSAQGMARVEQHLVAEARNGFSGAVVIGDGDVMQLSRVVGDAPPGSATPNYRLGDLAHPILAAAVLRLVDEGTLALQSPIAGIVRDMPAEWAGWTVHDVLVDRAGYAAVPRLIEAASGMPADAFVRARVIEPAGMTNTIVSPDGAIRASAEDLHRFVGQLKPGRLLTPQTVSAMMTPHRADARDTTAQRGYGLLLRQRAGQPAQYYQVAPDDGGWNGVLGVVGSDVFVVLSHAGQVDGVDWSHRINQGVQVCLGRVAPPAAK